ncbi:hypothetical protein D8796_09305 [Streptococcus cristatus]|uniref:Uncharacterized protein n=1 Tax=Streptococcus cristatus TaxID=45634 RepID=A0A3R9L3W5_STRCR|nr:hypothetical protein [Streptococcus cristatus]RSJ72790.1 hypothetical protein D8797_07205 [Streptococcus cristatus]RSJ78339.1 hypothetical protein D8796_09305 [Streptococcus cristatus]RSJ78632.1 hypothetical protein D8795_07700 [Streptococcus cristatus]RSJ84794.1 hypothetical protein D8793_08690 [Streptococcus cristatus]RSJ84890.1 hypothetical protein D8794_08215 [Streptococcus cristatus]
MGKRKKIIIVTFASILALVSLGGCAVTQKENNKEDKKVTSSKKDIADDKEAIKQKQLAYLKQHEQEIIDLVKAQNSKVESVQIDWDQTQWSDGGLTNPEYYINVFGRINNIKDSGWGVDIPINDDNTVNIDDMYIGSDIRIGGRLFA